LNRRGRRGLRLVIIRLNVMNQTVGALLFALNALLVLQTRFVSASRHTCS